MSTEFKAPNMKEVLEEEALAADDEVEIIPAAEVRHWKLPAGLAEWDGREMDYPAKLGEPHGVAQALLPGLTGPACLFRKHMTFLCPCGCSARPSHLASCAVMRFDGSYSRVVIARAYAMRSVLLGIGYPEQCVPRVDNPPVLPPALGAALAKEYKGDNAGIRWVLEEEDRVSKLRFGDYEAFVRTKDGDDIMVGPKRTRMLKGAKPGPMSPLPWQTPLMMLYTAEKSRLELSDAAREVLPNDEIAEAIKLTWKGLLLKYYQDKAAADQAEAKQAAPAVAETPVSPVPDFEMILGKQDTPPEATGGGTAPPFGPVRSDGEESEEEGEEEQTPAKNTRHAATPRSTPKAKATRRSKRPASVTKGSQEPQAKKRK